jgi:hypothetical protein
VSLLRARERAGEIVAAKSGIDLIAVRSASQRRDVRRNKARPLCETAKAYLDSVKRLRSWRDIESRELGNKADR